MPGEAEHISSSLRPDDAVALAPYVPRLARTWPTDAQHRRVDGTLLSADLSGFTRLSERLAALGREGAEELTTLLNGVFTGMIGIIERFCGDVIKFGGDALLVLYTGDNHVERACASTLAMRTLIAEPLTTSTGKAVRLRISQGFHTGSFDFFLLDAGHRELVVTGPDATETVECEGTANAGQILMSAAAAAHLDPRWLGGSVDERRLLRPVRDDLEAYAACSTDAPAVPLDDFLPAAQRDQITVGAPAEHRRVTIGFLKFSHTDHLLSEHGPEVLGARLQELASTISTATSELGVHLMATDIYPDGGKFILAAGAPVSFGNDEERMLRATRRILDEFDALDIRIGVNDGPVFVGDLGAPSRRAFTIMGDAVNLAARLMQKAELLQLIASDATLDRSATRFATESLEAFFVKGKTVPIHASVVLAVEEARAAQVRQLPLVGRDKELAVLSEAAASARTGHGRVVELVGEPGAGKSRLLAELRQHDSDLVEATIRCGQYARTTPYFAIRAALRGLAGIAPDATTEEAHAALHEFVTRHAPELLDLLPLIAIPFDVDVAFTPDVERIAPQFRRAQSHSAVATLVGRAMTAPTLLLVEDLHWIDDASRDLTEAVLAFAADRPWLGVLTRRPGPSVIDTAAVEITRIELAPLSADAARELVIAAAGDASTLRPADWEKLIERAGGNPLFAIELTDAAEEQGSADALADSVEMVVTSRIDTLPARDRLLLRETSVLGAFVDLALLAAALDDQSVLDVGRWRPLDDFVALRGTHAIEFRHAIHRHVAYEGLSFRRRREMHLRAAEAVRRANEADIDAVVGLLSTHYHSAGDHSHSWQFSVRAGDEARAKYANVEAAEFYGRALESARVLADLEASSVATVAEALGDVEVLSAQYPHARRAFASARRHVHARPVVTAELLRKEGRVFEREARYTQALRTYRRALTGLEAVEGDDAAGVRAALLAAYGATLYSQGKRRDAVGWTRRAIDAAEAAGNRPALAHALRVLELCLDELGDPERFAIRGLSLAICEELDDQVGLADELNNLGSFAIAEGRLDEALDLFERARRAREHAGDVIGEAAAINNAGEVMLEQGRYDEARPMFERALRVLRAAQFRLGVAVVLGNLGRAEGMSGDVDAALGSLNESIDLADEINATFVAHEMGVRKLEVLVHNGRDEAAELAKELERLPSGSLEDRFQAVLSRLFGWILLRAGDDAEARRYVDAAIMKLEPLGCADFGLALRARAELLRRAGDPSAAAMDDAAATQLFELLGVVWEPPLLGRAAAATA
jgi:class 3 adenylate cyclase/tetratricopeptide (TPR) repeat protein